MEVKLIDHMGTDLSVVNAAKASFGKESDWNLEAGVKYLSDRDQRLIQFLARGYTVGEWDQLLTALVAGQDKEWLEPILIEARNKGAHFTPFCHAFLSFKIKAPIFVARQLAKHQIGLAWNEESRRYISSDPEFYQPNDYRKAAENVKQGSSSELVPFITNAYDINEHPAELVGEHTEYALELYKRLLAGGVCAEQARMVLPQNTMTTWVWSGSLMAFIRVCKLRLDSHAQAETRIVAEQIATQVERLFPVSYKALMN
jgi:thymidylate synthase (FAD)